MRFLKILALIPIVFFEANAFALKDSAVAESNVISDQKESSGAPERSTFLCNSAAGFWVRLDIEMPGTSKFTYGKIDSKLFEVSVPDGAVKNLTTESGIIIRHTGTHNRRPFTVGIYVSSLQGSDINYSGELFQLDYRGDDGKVEEVDYAAIICKRSAVKVP